MPRSTSRSRTPPSRLYVVRVAIYEAASGYAFPVVTHLFTGRTRKEAWHYHESHRKSDAFLRQCEDKGTFAADVKCRIQVTEGWRATRRSRRDLQRDPRRSISRAKQRRISEKIRVLRHEGYPQRQAIAIAYRMEGVSRRARDDR